MFVAAAVCPHPPLLVPEVAQGAAPELAELRTACAEAVDALLAARPDAVVCVGDGPALRTYDERDGGTLRGLGVDTRAGGERSEDLPLAHTLGAWLLDRAGWAGPRRYFGLPRETSAQECAQMGQKVAAADVRLGVLAMGDGTAKRSEQAPGHLDVRAEPFDEEVVRALARPDPQWLVDALDPQTCAQLWVAGRQAWQFLAGAASQADDACALRATVPYAAAPYGVGYFVGRWLAC